MQHTIAIVGDGRLGRALAAALHTDPPHGRGYDGAGADLVLLCVPDGEIAAAAGVIAPGPLVGHCSAPRDSTRSATAKGSSCIR